MIAYSCKELLEYRRGAGIPLAHITEEIWGCFRRGKTAGVKVRERSERDRKFKLFLPSIIMGNTRSLANKTGELTALVSSECT